MSVLCNEQALEEFIRIDKCNHDELEDFNDAYNEILGVDTVSDTTVDWQECPKCNIRLSEAIDGTWQCDECDFKLQAEEYTYGAANGSTQYSDKTTINFGEGKSHTFYSGNSQYDSKCKSSLVAMMDRYSLESKTEKIPKYIVIEAVQEYAKIRKFRIHRGKNLKALLVYLIYLISIRYKIPKLLKELAAFYDIKYSYLSKAEATLKLYVSNENLELPIDVDHNELVPRYLEKFKISPKYDEMIREMITAITINKLYTNNSPKPSTQTICVIYFLTRHTEDLYDMELAYDESCKISKATLNRNYKILLEHKELFRAICSRHEIELILC